MRRSEHIREAIFASQLIQGAGVSPELGAQPQDDSHQPIHVKPRRCVSPDSGFNDAMSPGVICRHALLGSGRPGVQKGQWLADTCLSRSQKIHSDFEASLGIFGQTSITIV